MGKGMTVRTLHRLSSRRITTESKQGRYANGGGLYLQVSGQGTKSWLFRFMLNGKARQMGLGAVHTISLPEAREAALKCRKRLLEGIDPIKARNRWPAPLNRIQMFSLSWSHIVGQFGSAVKVYSGV